MTGGWRFWIGLGALTALACGGDPETSDSGAGGNLNPGGGDAGAAAGGASSGGAATGDGGTSAGGDETGGAPAPGEGGASVGGAALGGRDAGAGAGGAPERGGAGGGPASGGGSTEGGVDAGGAPSTEPAGGASEGGAAGFAGVAGAGAVVGGAGTEARGGAGGASAGELRLPPANAGFDYQLGEAYPPPTGVEVVVRDREAPPASGLYNVCYVNGLQTQPQDEAFWLETHPELVLRDSGGEPIVDEDWGELLLDTSTAQNRAALVDIVAEWIAGCAAAGFDAVEFDNLDTYDRSQGLLEADDNVAYLALLAAVAHEAGLAVAQKNAVELASRAAEMGTDFAIAEECNRWDECGDYEAAYGERVFVVEYRQQDFAAGCASHPELSIVLRDLDLTAPGSDTYVFDGC